MTSKRQQILAAIKNLVEADATMYNADVSNIALINVVNDEPSKPRRGKTEVNKMDIWCPDDIEATYTTKVGKVDESIIPVRVRMTLPNQDGDNDHVYQLMENLRTLIWANVGLGLDFVVRAHVDEDAPRVKPADVTLSDGSMSDISVLIRETF